MLGSPSYYARCMLDCPTLFNYYSKSTPGPSPYPWSLSLTPLSLPASSPALPLLKVDWLSDLYKWSSNLLHKINTNKFMIPVSRVETREYKGW